MEFYFRENKQEICNALCETLRLTTNAGTGNALVELRFIDEGYRQTVRPIFEDGNGENGWYDVNVSGDSGTAMIIDIVNHFVREVW